jgi:hypothetical protein
MVRIASANSQLEAITWARKAKRVGTSGTENLLRN